MLILKENTVLGQNKPNRTEATGFSFVFFAVLDISRRFVRTASEKQRQNFNSNQFGSRGFFPFFFG